MKDFLKQNWWLILALFAIGAWAGRMEVTMATDSKQAELNSQMILEAQKTANQALNSLDLMLKLGGITKQTYEDLRMLPTEPLDIEGVPYKEWYLIGDSAIYIIRLPDSCEAIVEKIPLGE